MKYKIGDKTVDTLFIQAVADLYIGAFVNDVYLDLYFTNNMVRVNFQIKENESKEIFIQRINDEVKVFLNNWVNK